MNDIPTSQPSHTATFAGGCFWCMEPIFRLQKGISTVTVGYAGDSDGAPTYEQVSTGRTPFKEAVQIEFDPEQTPYQILLEIFFRNINPTDAGGQFYDRGPQYQTAVYYHDDVQRHAAEQKIAELNASGKFEGAIVTQVLPYKNFYPAEDYHQEYYKKNPVRYQMYHAGSGRDEYLAGRWGGKPTN